MGKRLKYAGRKVSAIILIAALTMTVTGCTPFWQGKKIKNYEKEEKKKVSKETSETSSEAEEQFPDWDEVLETANEATAKMTVEEKVGQLFILNLEQLDTAKGNFYEHKKASEEMKRTLGQYHVGGVILFSRNLKNREQTIKLNEELQSSSEIPLFVAVDEEGGDVARVASNEKMKTTSFPPAEEVGKTKNDEYTYKMAKTIGSEIGELGFNVDFAPVADVKTSELNAEIGNRSFGDDPDKVSEHVSAFVQGLHYAGLCATLKHFPGQGSSSGDTHEDSVDIDSGIASLRGIDFVPFETGIEAGADFIMMSHISVSKVTESSVPASMSELMMKTILREELGFSKLIITDAFDMASITKYYDAGTAAVNAFLAGADIILMPQDFKTAYNAVLQAVNEETISMDRLDESVSRVLAVKMQRGILSELPD